MHVPEGARAMYEVHLDELLLHVQHKVSWNSVLV
jgi:hypothetical protein